jgi:hypothetical protein
MLNGKTCKDLNMKIPSKYEEKMKIKCPKCGFEDVGNFCSNCGAPLPQPDSLEPPVDASWLDRCPVCKAGKLSPITEKKLFGLVTTENIVCGSCSTVFTKVGEKYKLAKVRDVTNEIWREYGNQALTEREWENIAYGGMSDAKQREMDTECWLTQVREGNIIPQMGGEPESQIILKKKEEMVFAMPNVTLQEPRAVRQTVGGYGGPSFRVTKGVYFRTGGFGAQSESHEEIRVIDLGTLTLTDKRIVFSGAKRTVNIDLRKLVSVEPYRRDGIALRRSDRQKTQYFTGINQAELNIGIDGRTYNEPLSGLILMSMIEGLIKRRG